MLKNKKINDYIIVALLLIIAVVSFAYSFRQFYILNRFNLISSYKNKIQDILTKNHAPLSLENVDLIDTWMTFNYINIIFKMPADYLKNNLSISDKRYPNMSLNSYIKNQKLDKTIFLSDVKKAVTDYFINK